MPHEVVDKDEGCHGFNDGYGAGENARVMTAFALEFGGFSGLSNRGLFLEDGCRRLECCSEEKFFAVADPALYAA